MKKPECIAISEDEPRVWFRRTGGWREAIAARLVGASLLGDAHFLTVRLKHTHMRPFNEEDCGDYREQHGYGGDVDHCVCDFYREEGWHFACEATHRDAFPAWEVEARETPYWLDRLLHPRRTWRYHLSPRRALRLPMLRRLDLRPRWERHPHLDMARRGERDWQSGLELAAATGHGYSRLHYRPRDERTYRRARRATLRLPRIACLDLRPWHASNPVSIPLPSRNDYRRFLGLPPE